MSDLPFTLDQLRILKAIAVEGSFKRAADSLYVSQPAVSLQVQNLRTADWMSPYLTVEDVARN